MDTSNAYENIFQIAYSLSVFDRKSINSFNRKIPSSVMEWASAVFFKLFVLFWLETEPEFLVFLWKFQRNCFGLSVEQSTLKNVQNL